MYDLERSLPIHKQTNLNHVMKLEMFGEEIFVSVARTEDTDDEGVLSRNFLVHLVLWKDQKYMINLILTGIIHCISDVDPHWPYADPDPQILMNADPDPVRIKGNKITKLISNHRLKVIIFKSVPKLKRLATFLGSDSKNIISYEKTRDNLLAELWFSLNFIPLYPDPTGSGSTSLHCIVLTTTIQLYKIYNIIKFQRRKIFFSALLLSESEKSTCFHNCRC